MLIVAILDGRQMKDYLDMAHGLGMDALVEVHDEDEVDQALAAGSRLVGVNNRNLKDFSMDLATTFRLKKLVPDDIPLVSESGIRDHEDIERLAQAGVAAVLVGETLMRARDQTLALQMLRGVQAV